MRDPVLFTSSGLGLGFDCGIVGGGGGVDMVIYVFCGDANFCVSFLTRTKKAKNPLYHFERNCLLTSDSREPYITIIFTVIV